MFEPSRSSATSAEFSRPAPLQLRRTRTGASSTHSRYDNWNDREAIELQRIRSQYTRATDSYRPKPPSVKRPERGFAWLIHPVKEFWRLHISVVVDHEHCRDHLALERTFLAYVRTSLAFSMLGVTIAQLFRINHSPSPNDAFGFYVLGKPLACICQGVALYTLFLGIYRTWRQQHAIMKGKAIAGGLEINLLAIGTLVTCLLFFVLLIAIDVDKEDVD